MKTQFAANAANHLAAAAGPAPALDPNQCAYSRYMAQLNAGRNNGVDQPIVRQPAVCINDCAFCAAVFQRAQQDAQAHQPANH